MEQQSLEKKIKIGTQAGHIQQARAGGRGFYLPGIKEELTYYSQLFDAVEVNSTFYRPVHPKIAQSWARKTLEGFELTVKLWQKFTHPAIYREATGREEPSRKDDILFVRGPLLPQAPW